MTALALGETPSHRIYARSPEHLLRHHLFEGASGSGKTSVARECLAYLFRKRPEVPMLVLDGIGTLAADLAARLYGWIERREEAGADMRRMRSRILHLRVQPENESGLSFDLAKLRPKIDAHGFPRFETVHERVSAIMATLAHTTEGSEDYRLVHTYGSAAFAALVAGHRPVTELASVLTHGDEAYRVQLWIDIDRHGHRDAYVRAQLDVLNELYYTTQRSPVQFNVLTGSTRRNFAWLTQEYASFFRRDSIDYGAFHSRGGVLLVDPADANPTTAGIFRRALYGIRNAFLASRASNRPSLVVVDEQQGMNADLYALHVAMARNRSDYHWFLFQTGRQIGDRGAHYDEILSAMQHLVFFRPGTFESARQIATHLRRVSLTAARLPTLTKTTSATWAAGMSGDNDMSSDDGAAGTVTGEERVRITEALDAHALRLLELPIGTAYHIDPSARAIRVRHRYKTINPEHRDLAREAHRIQFVRLHVEERFTPPVHAETAPPPVTDAPQLPKTRKDRGRKDPKRRTAVDEGGETPA